MKTHIQRFSIDSTPDMAECPEGAWVRWGDVAPLFDAVRTLKDAKGRYNTEQAARKLFALLDNQPGGRES